MVWLHWFGENWFTALQTLAIVSGLVFPTITLRRDDRSRRSASLFQLTAHHRDVWVELFKQPELRRVLSPQPDLAREPVTDNEALFVGFLILHLNTAHNAVAQGLMPPLAGLGADIRTFFSRPIPRAVWNDLRRFQDPAFVVFIEAHFHSPN